MASFLAARRVEGGRWTIWLFGFNNQINHLVQLWGPSSCVEKGKKKEEERKKRSIYIIGTGLCQERINLKDNVHVKEKGKNTLQHVSDCGEK